MHIHISIHIYIHIYIHACIHAATRTYVRTYACMHTYVCSYIERERERESEREREREREGERERERVGSSATTLQAIPVLESRHGPFLLLLVLREEALKLKKLRASIYSVFSVTFMKDDPCSCKLNVIS